MTLKFLYWFFILMWLLFVGWSGYNYYGSAGGWHVFAFGGGSLLELILFCLIGVKLFGGPIEG